MTDNNTSSNDSLTRSMFHQNHTKKLESTVKVIPVSAAGKLEIQEKTSNCYNKIITTYCTSNDDDDNQASVCW